MRYLIAIWFVLYPMLLCGKDIPLLHYTIENGLPSNTVYDVCLDQKGFLWFATDKGVARFNGTKFETFTTYDGLPDNEVFNITADKYGRVWMSAYTGRIFYYRDGKFHTDANTPYLKLPFKGSMINQARLEKDSSITFYFMERTAFINVKSDQLKIYTLDKLNRIYPKMDIQCIRKISGNHYEICYLYRTITVDTNMTVLTDRQHEQTRFIMKETKGYFFNNDSIYTEGGKPLGAFATGFWNARGINNIYDDDENLFVSTTRGLFISQDVEVLNKVGISRVNRDRDGNYWITTTGDGVYVFNRHFKTTRFYRNVYTGSAKYARAEDTTLFIATNNKSLYNLHKDSVRCLFNGLSYVTQKTIMYKNGYLVDGNAYYTLGNGENYIVENIRKGVRRVKQFQVNLVYASEIFLCRPYIYILSSDEINCGRFSDMLCADNRNGFFMKKLGLKEQIYARAASKSNVWYSTIDKIYKIANDTVIAQPQFHNISFREIGIYGNYMVGCTHNNKLLVCNNFENNIRVDTVKNSNCVWGKFCKLDERHVLIHTNQAYRILTLHPSNGKPVYTIHVLEDPFIPLRAEYVCSNGITCFFLKDGNITCVRLKDMLAVLPAPTPVFVSFKTRRRAYAVDTAISLSYHDAKYISMALAAPAFAKTMFYEYAVTKQDDKDIWHNIKGEEIDLFNIGYGVYTVKVRTKTLSGNYSTPAVLSVYISRPYWAECWFIAACSIAGMGLIALLVRYSIRIALNKKEKEIRFLRSEYKALNALMNPHFIFNALNSVQGLINNNDKLSASEYLRTFSDLVRQNMQNVSQELIPLQKEIHLVDNYLKLEKLRFKDHLHYTIRIDDDIEPEEIMIPPLLIQPLVENSVKHGLFPKQSRDSYVLVDIYEDDAGLHIEVEDNGVGLNHDNHNLHDSFGLYNIRKRIDQLSLIHKIHIMFDINEMKDDEGIVKGTKAVILVHAQEVIVNRS